MSNGASKQLCIERFPQLASISHITEPSHNAEPASGDAMERVYPSLYRALTEFPQTNCIANPVSASSTDNYPEESIINTLEPGDKIQHRYSYWSSKGSDDPETPETLIYQLKDKFCVVTEINLQPFKAYFQKHFPVYSSRFVRFRMGHPKSWNEMDQNFMRTQECADDKFVWTYTSEMFLVAEENQLQRFKLPEPVVCIGGYLQIELLGRVQKQEIDGKYYICLAHVQVIGRQLSPAFRIEFSEQSDTLSLKYDSEAFEFTMQNGQSTQNDSSGHNVMSNGPSKQLCIERFPQLASISHITEPSHNAEPASGDAIERVYASLYRALTEFPQTNCIVNPVSASSTDNYPEESIINTLEPGDKVQYRASYWSSQGSDDPETPETLIYQLKDKFCVVTEINLQPFKAYFQMHFPVYSSRFVRFRMGHPKSWNEMDQNFMRTQECADDKFVWTYTSEMFLVAQENQLQRFKLPGPVVCIGGYLQIELLGRVKKQEIDGKYYICVAHVQVIGRQLSPAFRIEFSEQSDTVSLKYDSEAFEFTMQNAQSTQNDSSGHNGNNVADNVEFEMDGDE